MTSTRRLLLGGFCALAIAAGPEIGAQSSGEATSPASSQSEGDKVPWWGGRFALYLETGFGGASTGDVDTSLETTLQEVTFSAFDPGDRTYGRVAVGWQLPLNRGAFLVRMTGYKEDGGWELAGQGAAAFVDGEDAQPGEPLPWWSIHMTEGRIVALRNPPLWTNAQDADVDQ